MLSFVLASGCAGLPGFPQAPAQHPPAPAPAAGVGTANQDAAPPAPEGSQVHGRPGASGVRLNLAPGETAVDRALTVSQKLKAVEEEKQTLNTRLQELETALQEKDRSLQTATREIQAASEDVARSRAELQRWKQEMSGLRERLRNAEKENVTTLQSLVLMMEQVMERDKTVEEPREPPASADESRPAPN